MLLSLVLLLAGCGDKTRATSAIGGRAAQAKKTSLTITFSNTSGYVFNEIYICATAADDWGDELLGSTRILKSNGSIDVDVPSYDFDNYDILVVDEYNDEYFFTRIPLQKGSEVDIYSHEGELIADVWDAAGNNSATVYGTLAGAVAEEVFDAGGKGDVFSITFSFSNGARNIVFTELYLMPEDTSNAADMGYNHIAYVAPMQAGDYAAIEVDDHIYFDILLIDQDGNEWYYQGVFLEEDCLAYPTNHNGAGFTIEYADGSTSEYVGEIIF